MNSRRRLAHLLLASAIAVPVSTGAAAMETPQRAEPDAREPSNGARIGCRFLGYAARPLLEPLTGGAYDPVAWSRDRRQCYTLLSQAAMGVGAIAVSFSGHPRRSAAFGAGSFDRFFRDGLRSRSSRGNVFDGGVGALVHPLGMSGLLLLSASYAIGPEAYYDAATRALPLLWGGIGANTLPTAAAKRLTGRKRPFLRFQNRAAIEEFGIDEDARESFFSGHASTAFFSATFVDAVLSDVVRTRHPDYCLSCGTSWTERFIRLGQGVVAYGLAGAVAYSRIEIDKHFMSDVLVGALAGGIHGRLTYSLGYRATAGPPVEVLAAPVGQGIALRWRF